MQVLSVIPRKSRAFFLLLASTLLVQTFLTGCGGGGSSAPSVTNPQGDAGFTPDICLTPFSASSNEYRRTPNFNAMGLSPSYDIGLSGLGVVVGVLDSGVDSQHEELRGKVDGGGDWHGSTRGLEITRREVPVAIMGSPTSSSEMRMVLEAGAMGYIPKNIGIRAFFSSLTLMIEGQIFMPQETSFAQGEKNFLPVNDLTGRELDMLSGLLAGQSDKEIAIKYGIALVTVKHHLKSLRSKLGAKNRTHAVCRAIELGLTQQASEG